ncbi:hypothetical protein [Eoetvoesiella caeni]|uniref:hypothetical protein n=1 Tax=Eoetvoesiella caeni TaxID=645616 RepID=UPI0011BFE4A7|nr:hypothetical protein [Eoetvoesiella caeni]MCI2811301.1 hypothetical protein [Eoetvoesiella caeni]NYT57200.1 hypothetical protein [Eoetvoesiella caeni]
MATNKAADETFDESTLPPLFVPGNEKAGDDDSRCLRCGRKIKGKPVLMFRDWRTQEFHDFGGIPADGAHEPFPDGPYVIGPECADSLRQRARFFQNKLDRKLFND